MGTLRNDTLSYHVIAVTTYDLLDYQTPLLVGIIPQILNVKQSNKHIQFERGVFLDIYIYICIYYRWSYKCRRSILFLSIIRDIIHPFQTIVTISRRSFLGTQRLLIAKDKLNLHGGI